MLVMKFGGTSVGDAGAFRRVSAIVRNSLEQQPVVVVSAVSGVTTGLLELARRAQTGDSAVAGEPVVALIARHRTVVHASVSRLPQKRLWPSRRWPPTSMISPAS